MNKAVCALSVVPLREEPSDLSEQVSQLLFGESVEIIDQKNQWVKIKTDFDQYEGWIDEKQVIRLQHSNVQDDHSMVLELAYPLIMGNEAIPLVLGCSLPHFDGVNGYIEKRKYSFNGTVFNHSGSIKNPNELVEKIALKYLNAPYLWGGRSPFGIDCSGFTQMVFKFLGIQLKRDAYQQEKQGSNIDLIATKKTGDLAFFMNDKGKVHHVGILLNDFSLIHASGRVKIDRIDNFGIFSKEMNQYTHKLCSIRRFF